MFPKIILAHGFSLQNKIFFLLDIQSTKYLAFQHICWTEPKVAGPKKTVVTI